MEAKVEFNWRKGLPDSDERKMRNMVDWLIYYNTLDTQPLCEAVSRAFEKFRYYFGVDASNGLTLPSLAYKYVEFR